MEVFVLSMIEKDVEIEKQRRINLQDFWLLCIYIFEIMDDTKDPSLFVVLEFKSVIKKKIIIIIIISI